MEFESEFDFLPSSLQRLPRFLRPTRNRMRLAFANSSWCGSRREAAIIGAWEGGYIPSAAAKAQDQLSILSPYLHGVTTVFASTTSGDCASSSRTAMRQTLKLSTIIAEEDAMARNGMPAIHPGEFLAEILEDVGLSQASFARKIGVSPMRVSHVIGGRRPVTADLALRLGRAFSQTPEYWLNLQVAYDLKKAATGIGKRLERIEAITDTA